MNPTDSSQRKNVLVTGGAGFIGSHLCDSLITTCNVICLDNLISGNIDNINHLLHLPNFEFIRHDLSEPTDLDAFPELKKFKLPYNGLQEIYHLACPTSHYEKHAHQLATAITSSHGTKNVLDLAVKHKSKLMFASSSAVYGEPEPGGSELLNENNYGRVNQLGERGCYDEGKRFAETLIMVYREQFQIDARIARIFQTYGPRMSMEDNRLIPRLISHTITNEPLVVYGDPELKTSLCYIADMIEGISKFMQSDLAGPINLGSDTTVSYRNIAEYIKELTATPMAVSYELDSPYIAHRGMPDIKLAKDKLGWFPVVPIKEGLKLTIANMRGSRVVRMQDLKL
jgi:UDP-glucuronate decarboxylase